MRQAHQQWIRSSLFDRGHTRVSSIRLHLIKTVTLCSLEMHQCHWYFIFKAVYLWERSSFQAVHCDIFRLPTSIQLLLFCLWFSLFLSCTFLHFSSVLWRDLLKSRCLKLKDMYRAILYLSASGIGTHIIKSYLWCYVEFFRNIIYILELFFDPQVRRLVLLKSHLPPLWVQPISWLSHELQPSLMVA